MHSIWYCNVGFKVAPQVMLRCTDEVACDITCGATLNLKSHIAHKHAGPLTLNSFVPSHPPHCRATRP